MLWGGLWLGLENHYASVWIFLWATLGTAFLVASANTFNMIYERRTDALMTRTKNRPLVKRRIPLRAAWAWAFLLAIAGALILKFGTCLYAS
jgi:protoheme IX farnesyltransferase